MQPYHDRDWGVDGGVAESYSREMDPKKGGPMGVRFERTALVAPGKREDAMQFAGAIAGYVGETFGTELTWGIEVGGAFGRIHWYADYANMAELEIDFGRTMSDEGYLKLVDDAEDVFLPGRTEDKIVYTM